MSAEELKASLLRSEVSFAREWLAEDDKTVVPLPMSASDASVIVGYAAACRRAGYGAVFAVLTGVEGVHVEELRLPVPGGESGWAGAPVRPCLLTPRDRSNALLVTGRGYGLLAGTREFLALALPRGVDAARVDFARYARRVRANRHELAAVASEFAGRRVSSRTPADLNPVVGAGRQVRLMREFAAGRLNGPTLLAEWMAARRESQVMGERLHDALSNVMEEAFSALERYEVYPELAEPEDLTEDELRSMLTELLVRIDRLS